MYSDKSFKFYKPSDTNNGLQSATQNGKGKKTPSKDKDKKKKEKEKEKEKTKTKPKNKSPPPRCSMQYYNFMYVFMKDLDERPVIDIYMSTSAESEDLNV